MKGNSKSRVFIIPVACKDRQRPVDCFCCGPMSIGVLGYSFRVSERSITPSGAGFGKMHGAQSGMLGETVLSSNHREQVQAYQLRV